MGHYAWYSLSHQGRHSSNVVFTFVSFVAQAFTFAYLGLTFFSYDSYPWSWKLFGVGLAMITIGRGIGSMGFYLTLKGCGYDKGSEKGMDTKELLFIWYAGLIRGAIAFGLVLRVDDFFPNRQLIVTTCLSLVVFTTIFCGSTIGLVSSCLFNESDVKENDDDFTELSHPNLIHAVSNDPSNNSN